jgi:hypothetical protein
MPSAFEARHKAINGTSFISSISVFAESKNSSYSSFGIIVIFSNSKLRMMSNSSELILAFLLFTYQCLIFRNFFQGMIWCNKLDCWRNNDSS